MSFKIQKCLNNEEWDEFVTHSPQNNIFCQSKFLKIYHSNYDLFLLWKGKLILAGVIILKDSKGRSVKQQFVYQGILFSQYVESTRLHKKVRKKLEIVQYFLNELESLYVNISLSLHHSIGDLRGFQWHNYHDKNSPKLALNLYYTGILDLSKIENFDQILMGVRTVRRQEYKKYLKSKFTVEESDDINTLNYLHNKTFERQGLKRKRAEVFLATTLAKKIISTGIGRLLICRDESGTPVSANLFIFDDNTGYYLIGANDPDYRFLGVGGVVVLEQIRYCIERGLTYVDFMGVNSPLRGDFKVSFNANPTPYFEFSIG